MRLVPLHQICRNVDAFSVLPLFYCPLVAWGILKRMTVLPTQRHVFSFYCFFLGRILTPSLGATGNSGNVLIITPQLLSTDGAEVAVRNDGDLKLEITETGLMENRQAASDLLSELKKQQIRLAIDDFGTGYSSLSYLHQFPVDTLKVDQSFVKTLAKDEEAEIVRATIALVHSLNLDVVAEGIETDYQRQLLTTYGCEMGQGYFFSRPLETEAATQYLKHQNQAILT